MALNLICSKAVDIVCLFIRQLRQLFSLSSTEDSEPYNITIQKIITSGPKYISRWAASSGSQEEMISIISSIMRQSKKLEPLVLEVTQKAPSYDFDVPMNGYRTFVRVAEKVAKITLQLFQKQSANISRLRQLNEIHETLLQLFGHLSQMMSHNPEGELLTEEDFPLTELIRLTKEMHFQSFFGHFLGLQFDRLLSWQLKWVFGWFTQEIREERRAERLINMYWHADVDKIRNIWNSSDGGFLWLLCRLMKPIAHSSQYQGNDVASGEKINGRLISSVLRPGIMGGSEPLASSIVIHVHGGGFISNSSKATEVYLRDWANHLKVPIFSVDYSLSPEHRYPTAMHQIVAAYQFIRQNPTLFGTTATKIVLAGESAGASLILGAMFVCIEKKIPLPDGLFLVNVPVQMKFQMSPSRLLSNMDPLLPFGFMLRCAAAYLGEEIHSNDSESFKSSCIFCEDAENPIHNEYLQDRKLRIFDIPDLHYYNCLKAPDNLLRQLPRTSLCSASADPVLDEMIMFGKRLRNLGNEVSLKVFQDLPHGFLNFALVHGAASKATLECAQEIGILLKS